VTEPYAPPSAALAEELPPRSRHGRWAFLSALLVLLGLWAGGLIFYGFRPWSIGWLVPVRAIAIFLGAALVAGYLIHQIPRLKWYWAVLAGPVLAAVILAGVALSYYFVYVYHAPV
jgi:hypothetical protein